MSILQGIKRVICLFLAACFLFQSIFTCYGQAFVPTLTPPAQSFFNPPTLKYLSVNSANPHNYFNFLLDKGSKPALANSGAGLEQEAKKLIHYFFIGLTLPESSLWVNLRPDEPGRITSLELAQTDMGKLLLEQDLQLKKDVAQYLNPSQPVGKRFWEELYTQAELLLGKGKLKKTAITTSNRVWIVPDEAVVMETEDGALVTQAKLKVLLESEYLSLKAKSWNKEVEVQIQNKDQLKNLTEQLMKSIIIPEITKEVNSGQSYAPLRQIYHSLILAQWFKRKNSRTREPKNHYVQAIDQSWLKGLESELPWSKDAIWREYLASFQKGEYQLKEKLAGLNRMYTSGGILFNLGVVDPKTGSSPLQVIAYNGAGSPLAESGDRLPVVLTQGRSSGGGSLPKTTIRTISSASPIEGGSDNKLDYSRDQMIYDELMAGRNDLLSRFYKGENVLWDLRDLAKNLEDINGGLMEALQIYTSLWMKDEMADVIEKIKIHEKSGLAGDDIVLPRGLIERMKAYERAYRKKYGLEEKAGYSWFNSLLAAYSLREKYDIAIGIAGAGVFTSSVFDLLGVKTVLASVHNQGREFKWLDEVDEGIFKGKRIIIIENDLLTGGTLRRLVEEIGKYGPKQLDVIFDLPGRVTEENIPGENITGKKLVHILNPKEYLDLSSLIEAVEAAREKLNMSDSEIRMAPTAASPLANSDTGLKLKNSTALRISEDPKIMKIWQQMVKDSLELYQFAQNLSTLTERYGLLHNIPEQERKSLFSMIDLASRSEDDLLYILGFIMLNMSSGIEEEDSWGRQDDKLLVFKWNLAFIAALQRANVSDTELFVNQQNHKVFDNVYNSPSEFRGLLSDYRIAHTTVDWYRFFWSPAVRNLQNLVIDQKRKESLIKELEYIVTEIFQHERLSFYEVAPRWYGKHDITARAVMLDEWRDQFDPNFFKHPRKYIEAQEAVESPGQLSGGRNIIGQIVRERFLAPVLPGDIYFDQPIKKVRRFALKNGQTVYAKLINPLRVRYPEEEMEVAERINVALQAANSHFKAQDFIGIVYDEGSFFLLSLAVPATHTLIIDEDNPVSQPIQKILEKQGVIDYEGPVRLKDILVSKNPGGESIFTVIDFETHPYVYMPKAVSPRSSDALMGKYSSSAASPLEQGDNADSPETGESREALENLIELLDIEKYQKLDIDAISRMRRSRSLYEAIPELIELDRITEGDRKAGHIFTRVIHSIVALLFFEGLPENILNAGVGKETKNLIGEIKRELSSRELYLLRLAILLHDIGKRPEKNHLEPSHEEHGAADVLPRILGRIKNLTEEDRKTISYLVEHHSVLGNFDRSVDINYPEFIVVAADILGKDLKLIKMLYLLNVVDSIAVNPKKYKDSSDRLLSITEAFSAIKKGRIEEAEGIVKDWYFKEILPDKDRKIKEQYLELVGLPFIAGAGFKRINDHLSLLEAVSKKEMEEAEEVKIEVRVALSDFVRPDREKYKELVVAVSRDKPGLLRAITEVLADWDYDIHLAWINTADIDDKKIVFDRFLIKGDPTKRDNGNDEYGQKDNNQDNELKKAITHKIESFLKLEDANKANDGIKEKLHKIAIVNLKVSFSDIKEAGVTRMVIEAKDRTGLLSDIMDAISKLGINVPKAEIETRGSNVKDTFYVQENGKPLSEESKEQLSMKLKGLTASSPIEEQGKSAFFAMDVSEITKILREQIKELKEAENWPENMASELVDKLGVEGYINIQLKKIINEASLRAFSDNPGNLDTYIKEFIDMVDIKYAPTILENLSKMIAKYTIIKLASSKEPQDSKKLYEAVIKLVGIKEGNALEIGPGYNKFPAEGLKKALNVIMVDMLDGGEGMQVKADATNLSFPDKSVEAVVYNQSFPFIARIDTVPQGVSGRTIAKALGEAYRVLKPGGWILIKPGHPKYEYRHIEGPMLESFLRQSGFENIVVLTTNGTIFGPGELSETDKSKKMELYRWSRKVAERMFAPIDIPVFIYAHKPSTEAVLEEAGGKASSPVKSNIGLEKSRDAEYGGIDLSQIEVTLKDEKFVSHLNPADLKVLRAAKYMKEGWGSLALLYVYEIMLLLKDNLAGDIKQKGLLREVLKQLQVKGFAIPEIRIAVAG